MSTPILATKLFIPPPSPRAVLRPRLLERLNEGLARAGGVTLISAPAGFGKSTLLSEWIATLNSSSPVGGAGVRVSWLSLDEADNDLPRFLLYLISTLQKIESGVGMGALNLLQAPQQPSVETILTVLINDLAAVPPTGLLVLDDVHLLDSKPVENALAYLIEHLPPHVHLILATREDPPVPLARLRARGRLTELRAADLRFTLPEATTFLNQRMGLHLTLEETAALEARTEGWIAGLQLAALSIQGHKDTAGFIQSFTGSHHFVMDYLMEEVLQRQPLPIQSFLLSTSILNPMCGPLCDAVLSASPPLGQETLETLERANLLVIPLDEKRQWYRYHHLFADVLRARLTKEQPQNIAALHARAGVWFAQHGFPAEAIRHALAAHEFEQAAGWLEHEVRAMRTGIQEAVWMGWVKALPENILRAHPVLCANYALGLISIEPHAAEALLEHAEQRLAHPTSEMVVTNEKEFQSVAGVLSIARAYRAGALGDVPTSIRHASQALENLPADDHFWRGAAAALLGIAYWNRGDLDEAHRFVSIGTADLQQSSGLYASTSGNYLLADIRLAQGRLREAAQFAQQALERTQAHSTPAPQGTADLYVVLSDIGFEQNDMDGATRHLEQSRALGEYAALLEPRFRWYVAMANIKQAQGLFDEALALLTEAQHQSLGGPVPNFRPIAAQKARLWLAQGKLTEALNELHGQGVTTDDEPTLVREFELLTLGHILLVQGDWAALFGLLKRLGAAAQAGGRKRSVIEVHILQALARQARGEISEAVAALKQALGLAEAEGFIRIFLAEGAPMADLLQRVKDVPFARTVLSALEDGARPLPDGLLEPLSDRELEILQLIAQGFSNQEISARLYLALSTVKGYNQRIFAKLNVQRRTEAIARARELGLL